MIRSTRSGEPAYLRAPERLLMSRVEKPFRHVEGEVLGRSLRAGLLPWRATPVFASWRSALRSLSRVFRR